MFDRRPTKANTTDQSPGLPGGADRAARRPGQAHDAAQIPAEAMDVEANQPARSAYARKLQSEIGNAGVARLIEGMTNSAREAAAENPVTVSGPVREEIEAQRGAGGALPHETRELMQGQTGAPLQDVRMHADAPAGRLAQQLGAPAFSSGADVFFAPGAYDPAHPKSLQVLAHELTHVAGNASAASDSVYLAPGGPDAVATVDALAPSSAIAPVSDETTDGEGNRIGRSESGRWYLLEYPKDMDFPALGGGRYELYPPNPHNSYFMLKMKCEAIRQEQLEYAEKLRGDMKYWFAKVYYYVSTFELEAIEAGTYMYPHMKMQEIVHFQETYKRNIDNWEAGNKDQVEANWQEAFAQAEAQNDEDPLMAIDVAAALLPSMDAHIRFDLPRAIAAAYRLNYAGIPDTTIGDFEADFFAMDPVFEKATAALQPEIEEATSAADPGNWQWLQDALFPTIFDVPLERQMAWEKAVLLDELASGMPPGDPAEMEAEMRARYPDEDPFAVGGAPIPGRPGPTDITGYDWMNQPGIEMADQLRYAGGFGFEPVHQAAPEPPEFPSRLYFIVNLPAAGASLSGAVRKDQDLEPYRKLAAWLGMVKDAEVVLEGRASSDGSEEYNSSLSETRVQAMKAFLESEGADLKNNRVRSSALGEEEAEPGPDWRFVEVRVEARGVAKQTEWPTYFDIPSEGRLFDFQGPVNPFLQLPE